MLYYFTIPGVDEFGFTFMPHECHFGDGFTKGMITKNPPNRTQADLDLFCMRSYTMIYNPENTPPLPTSTQALYYDKDTFALCYEGNCMELLYTKPIGTWVPAKIFHPRDQRFQKINPPAATQPATQDGHEEKEPPTTPLDAQDKTA